MSLFRRVVVLSVLSALLPSVLFAQYASQSVVLQPGWNAVFLEVDPSPADVDVILSGLPVLGVYEWDRNVQAPQFELDPQSPLPPAVHWKVWKPEAPPGLEASLNTLFVFKANTSYLIEVDENAAPFTINLLGRVRRHHVNWLPFSFNLVGFPTSPGSPPSFAEFFSGSDAFDISHKLPGHFYALNANGGASQLDQRSFMSVRTVDADIAYWVKAGNPSSYRGPLDFTLGSTVDFGANADIVPVPIRNTSDTPLTARVTLRGSEPAPQGLLTPQLVPLAYYAGSVDTNLTNWVTWSAGAAIEIPVPAGETRVVGVAVRRDAIAQGQLYASWLELTDVESESVRIRLPITATDEEGDLPQFHPHQGLWIGEARLSHVNAPYIEGDTALPTGGTFPLRVLMHVDEVGDAHLLQSAVLGLVPAGSDSNLVYQLWSARNPVLPSNLAEARRVSSTGFPVMDPLSLSGNTTTGLVGQLVIEPNDPQNPFLHTFHPSHDNRDANYNSFGAQAVETPRIIRNLSLQFDPVGNDLSSSLFGSDSRTGTFREEVLGLRRDAVITHGPVRFTRVVKVGQLNP